MQSKLIAAALTIFILSVLVISQTPVSAIESIPSDLNIGPYVDKIVYKVIEDQDQRHGAVIHVRCRGAVVVDDVTDLERFQQRIQHRQGTQLTP